MGRISLLLFIIGWPMIGVGQENCTLKREEDHLKIFTCRTHDSKFKAVKVLLDVESTLSQVAAMILDIDSYSTWQYGTVQARMLKKLSDRELYYYHEVEAPLVDNRDFAIRLVLSQDPVTRVLTIEAVSEPDFVPRREDIVRVPFSRAVWVLKASTPGTVQVDYHVELDLGGELPAWIVNPLAPRASFETFDGFRREIARYKDKGVPFIKD